MKFIPILIVFVAAFLVILMLAKFDSMDKHQAQREIASEGEKS